MNRERNGTGYPNLRDKRCLPAHRCGEAGGSVPTATVGFREANESHLLVNTICFWRALLVYNVLTLVRRHLGPGVC